LWCRTRTWHPSTSSETSSMVSGTTRSGLATNEPEQLIPDGALAFVCSEVCSFSTVSDGVGRLIINHRAVCPSLAWNRSGLLPSAGVTRRHRYYEPIRHLRSPSLALAGSTLAWSCHPSPRSQTSLVAHRSCPVRAAITTPVESPAAFLARFTDDGDLPRCYGGSAPTLTVSRPARCSLTLRPARSAGPLRNLFSKCFRPFVAS